MSDNKNAQCVADRWIWPVIVNCAHVGIDHKGVKNVMVTVDYDFSDCKIPRNAATV